MCQAGCLENSADRVYFEQGSDAFGAVEIQTDNKILREQIANTKCLRKKQLSYAPGTPKRPV